MNLYRRHLTVLTALFLLIVGLFAWLTHQRIQKHIDDTKLERVELLTEIVNNGLKSIMLEGKPKEEFQRFLETIAAEDIHAVRIFSDSGTILSSSVPGEVGQMVDELHISAFRAHKGSALLTREIKGQRIYSSIVVMSNDWPCQRCHGEDEKIRAIINLDVKMDKIDKEETVSVLWSLAGYLSLVAMLVLAVAYHFRKHVSGPLANLRAELKHIGDGDPGSRATLFDEDELNAVAAEVNRMAIQLENAREEIQGYASRETGHLEKMASIGELAATVAHEIKNPLAGISGALQVMAEDIPDQSPRKEICNEILSEIERLDRSVRELIAFARPQEINPADADINQIADEAIKTVRPDAEALGVRIDLIKGMLPRCMADSDQLGKVIANVMQYQLQLMPDGGVITVLTEHRAAEGESVITLADTAVALSADRRRNIFRPSFSTKHTGSGLGLAVSRNIIEAHGGRIKVESEPGIGNFFHIIMPVRGNNGKS